MRRDLICMGVFVGGFTLTTFLDVQPCRAAQDSDPVRPAWLDEVAGYELPKWFDCASRVHFHTRLSIGPARSWAKKPIAAPSQEYGWLDTPTFLDATAVLQSMGSIVLTRHIVSGDEGAWWPSKVGDVLPVAADRNIAAEIIDRAHVEGSRIIVYYRHMEDAGMAKQHPEWLCRDGNGDLIDNRRGLWMCLNSPYADFVQTRLLELVDMGADGFYFDERHQPDLCRCEFCRENAKNKQTIIEDTFLKWRQAIHKHNRHAVLLVSGRFEGLSHRLFRIPDSVKIEPHLVKKYGGVWKRKDHDPAAMSLGLTFLRDAADERPAHLWWTSKKESTLHDSAQVMTHGSIFNFDVRESYIKDPESDAVKTGKKHAALAKKISPYLTSSKRLRWALIHYPEGASGPENTKIFGPEVVLPYYRKLLQIHLPVGIITDTQLAEGVPDGCDVLILPDLEKCPLSAPPIRKAVAQFETHGGTVVRGPLSDDFAKVIEPKAQLAPVQVVGDDPDVQMVAYQHQTSNHITVALYNPGEQTVEGMQVSARLKKAPTRAFEVITGKELEIENVNGRYQCAVPEFTLMAMVVIE